MRRIPWRKLLLVAGSAFLALLAMIVYAGNLDPPGPPGPTMRTLDEIYDLLLSIFERQEAAIGPESVGSESRMIGCLEIVPTVGADPLESVDPADLRDPICGPPGHDPAVPRIIASTQEIFVAPPQSNEDLHQAFVVTKNVDSLSPVLFQNLIQGTVLEFVRFRWYRPDGAGGSEQYMTIELHLARVVSQSYRVLATPDGFLHVEDVGFAYRDITWTHETAGTTYNDGNQ